MKIQLLAEGSTKHERKILRWGLSFLVGDVLFDTFGRADIFWGNIRRFRLDLSGVKHVVISHDDWDHVAGLESFLLKYPKMRVYVCKKAGKVLKGLIRQRGVTLSEVSASREICSNIFSLGQMRTDTGRGILYEQALVVRSRNGFSVITGCAHPGIVRIVKQAREVFGNKLYAVCGGFHMKDNTPENNMKIIAELQILGVKKVIPLHCSGPAAGWIFGRFYGKNCIQLHEGDAFKL